MPCHPSDFHCLTISVIFTVSPLQRFSASHLLSEFSCPMTWVIVTVSPSQWFSMSHHVSDFSCLANEGSYRWLKKSCKWKFFFYQSILFWSKSIDPENFWLCHLKKKISFFLAVNIKNLSSRREMSQLSQVPQIENRKPDFSPLFQKVKLCNSTFFQPSQRFSVSCHLSDFQCLTIAAICGVSPSQWIFMSHDLSDCHCLTISVIFNVSPCQWFFMSYQWGQLLLTWKKL